MEAALRWLRSSAREKEKLTSDGIGSGEEYCEFCQGGWQRRRHCRTSPAHRVGLCTSPIAPRACVGRSASETGGRCPRTCHRPPATTQCNAFLFAAWYLTDFDSPAKRVDTRRAPAEMEGGVYQKPHGYFYPRRCRSAPSRTRDRRCAALSFRTRGSTKSKGRLTRPGRAPCTRRHSELQPKSPRRSIVS